MLSTFFKIGFGSKSWFCLSYGIKKYDIFICMMFNIYDLTNFLVSHCLKL